MRPGPFVTVGRCPQTVPGPMMAPFRGDRHAVSTRIPLPGRTTHERVLHPHHPQGFRHLGARRRRLRGQRSRPDCQCRRGDRPRRTRGLARHRTRQASVLRRRARVRRCGRRPRPRRRQRHPRGLRGGRFGRGVRKGHRLRSGLQRLLRLRQQAVPRALPRNRALLGPWRRTARQRDQQGLHVPQQRPHPQEVDRDQRRQRRLVYVGRARRAALHRHLRQRQYLRPYGRLHALCRQLAHPVRVRPLRREPAVPARQLQDGRFSQQGLPRGEPRPRLRRRRRRAPGVPHHPRPAAAEGGRARLRCRRPGRRRQDV